MKDLEGEGGGDDDDEQKYHVGGSGKGGGSDQQVVGWGKENFEKARAAGAVSADEHEAKEDDFRFKVTFWKNGFSVNDGPLRTGETPEDQAFIQDIDNQTIPGELQAQCAGKEPVVDLIDSRGEEYKEPPKPKYVKFGGEGMSLGGAARVEIDASAPLDEVNYKFVLDESAKTTKLQLTFHDGTKKVQKFNLTHTVQDIRLWMMSEKPLPMGTTFNLQTAFDKKVLEDPHVTIQDGGLRGESIMQILS